MSASHDNPWNRKRTNNMTWYHNHIQVEPISDLSPSACYSILEGDLFIPYMPVTCLCTHVSPQSGILAAFPSFKFHGFQLMFHDIHGRHGTDVDPYMISTRKPGLTASQHNTSMGTVAEGDTEILLETHNPNGPEMV